MLRSRPRSQPHHAPPGAPAPAGAPQRGGERTTWRGPLPFDYAVTLPFRGEPGRIVQGAITVGPEAAFVATGIAYAFDEDLVRPIPVEAIQKPAPAAVSFVAKDLTLAQLPPRALVDGFRLSPRALPLVFALDPDTRFVNEPESLTFRTDAYSWARVGEIFQRFDHPPAISFLISLIDSATGRELQDEPTHNVASLGADDGRRPFRPLARPMAFLPRSTIRVQAIERQSDRTGRLDVVLTGYKVPATSAVSEDDIRRAIATQLRRPPHHFGDRLIPFDYVAQVPLTGNPGEVHEAEIAINSEGAFVATGISYALDASAFDVGIDITGLTLPAPDELLFDLGSTRLERFSPDALLEGIRLRPEYARLAFDANGVVNGRVRIEMANQLFERVNRADAVRFRYRLGDGGAGRDLQNQRIFSLAGLGSADGRRPFRQFARPLTFEPRSTFRVFVDEIAGRGVLHLVLQGYKRLEGGRTR